MLMLYSSIVTCIVAYKSIGVIIVQSTHFVAKFIRSMPHSVIGNDLIGLLKSCSVSLALEVQEQLEQSIRCGTTHFKKLRIPKTVFQKCRPILNFFHYCIN